MPFWLSPSGYLHEVTCNSFRVVPAGVPMLLCGTALGRAAQAPVAASEPDQQPVLGNLPKQQHLFLNCRERACTAAPLAIRVCSERL